MHRYIVFEEGLDIPRFRTNSKERLNAWLESMKFVSFEIYVFEAIGTNLTNKVIDESLEDEGK